MVGREREREKKEREIISPRKAVIRERKSDSERPGVVTGSGWKTCKEQEVVGRGRVGVL